MRNGGWKLSPFLRNGLTGDPAAINLLAVKKVRRKRLGSPQVNLRVPRLLLAKVRMVAKLYGEDVPVFIRAMLEATCSGDGEKAVEFQTRVARGVIAHRQRALDLGEYGLTAPGQSVKDARKELGRVHATP